MGRARGMRTPSGVRGKGMGKGGRVSPRENHDGKHSDVVDGVGNEVDVHRCNWEGHITKYPQ